MLCGGMGWVLIPGSGFGRGGEGRGVFFLRLGDGHWIRYEYE